MLNTWHISGIRDAIFTFTIDFAFSAGFARFNKQCFGLSNKTAKDKNFDRFTLLSRFRSVPTKSDSSQTDKGSQIMSLDAFFF